MLGLYSPLEGQMILDLNISKVLKLDFYVIVKRNEHQFYNIGLF